MMLKKLNDFLAGLPMTIVAGVFLRCIPTAGFSPALDGGIWWYAGAAFVSAV